MRRERPGRAGLVWAIRCLLPDRNPLRRAADRIEAAVVVGLLAVLLAGVPLAAVAAGSWQRAASLQTVRGQAAWRGVPAVLLRSAPRTAPALRQASLDPSVLARWTAPSGPRRTGYIYAPAGARAGSTVTVWVNRAGQVVGEPLQKVDVTGRVVLAALAGAAITAVALLAVWLLARWVLDRRRLAAWDVSWAEIEPQWTGRI